MRLTIVTGSGPRWAKAHQNLSVGPPSGLDVLRPGRYSTQPKPPLCFQLSCISRKKNVYFGGETNTCGENALWAKTGPWRNEYLIGKPTEQYKIPYSPIQWVCLTGSQGGIFFLIVPCGVFCTDSKSVFKTVRSEYIVSEVSIILGYTSAAIEKPLLAKYRTKMCFFLCCSQEVVF
jgi:hypothetical protein